MNTTHNDINDPFKTLFNSKEISNPGIDFTTKVMGKIEELESAKVTTNKTSENLYIWLLSIAGLIITITTLILLSNFGYINIFPEKFDFVLLPVFKKVILNFREIFSSFSLSSTTVAILAALTAIVIFERLLRRLSLSKNTYLLSL